MTCLVVHSAGPGVSLQDAGRRGYLRFGVTHAGPMDSLSHALANLAVGNDRTATAIEVSLGGLEISSTSAALDVAVVGGAFNVARGGAGLPSACRLTLKTGERLKVAAGTSGSWCYVAVAAKFALPNVLGSQATHTRSGFGGVDGRGLSQGDKIQLTDARSFCVSEGRLNATWLERSGKIIRVLPGPQRDYFETSQYEAFLDGPWEVSAHSDRMAVFVDGPRLQHCKGYDIVSDGVAMGSVQVPGDGLPIVLMADSQSTGGYPKIATVIGADLGALAQNRPGTQFSFASVSHEEAVDARRVMERNLAASIEVEPFVRTEFTREFIAGLNLENWAPQSVGEVNDEERHEPGRLTHTERLSLLFDAAAFRRSDHGNLATAEGRVYGVPVLAFAHEHWRASGAVGPVEVKALKSLREQAYATRIPLVGLYDGAAQDCGDREGNHHSFAHLARQSAPPGGLEIAIVFGQALGPEGILARLADIVLTAGNDAGIALAGTHPVERIWGQSASFSELALAEGAASACYNDELSALLALRRLVAITSDRKSARLVDPPNRIAPGLDRIDQGASYEMADVLRSVADHGEVFELRPSDTSSVITALMRMGGIACGVVASQPHVNAGLLSATDMVKAGDFLSLCAYLELPLLRFVDVPGVLPGRADMREAPVAAFARLLQIECRLLAPRVTVVIGKASGLAAIAMGTTAAGGARVFRWPSAAVETPRSGPSPDQIIRSETRATVIGALQAMMPAGK